MSIDAVVESLAERIDRALVLYDNDLQVLAYSAHSGEVDEARRMAILTRRGTKHAHEMMRRHGAASNVGPLRLPEEDGVPARIVYPVRHEGYVLGYLVYVEPGEPAEVLADVRAQLDRHASELGPLLVDRDLDRQESRVRLRMLVSDLMSTEPTRRTSAAHTLVADKLLPTSTAYTAVALVAGGPAATGTPERNVLETMLSTFIRSAAHAAVGAVIEGAAIAILTGRADAEAKAPGRSRAGSTVGQVGFGAPVAELVDVYASARQARIAARACLVDPQRYPGLARWDDLGLDRLLLQLPLDQLTIEDLPPAVARLIQAEAGPDLAATVEAYLDCAGDAQATAARLTIHRSTFYYRLDRARALTGADLHDGAVRRELHTGLRVARLAGLGLGRAGR